MKFTTKTIDEVTETLIDYRGNTPPKSNSGVWLITAKVIKDGFVVDGNREFITDVTYERWMTRGFPNQWDILITTEAPLGEVAQLRTVEKVALAQRIILLRGNPEFIDQQYYFQVLKSPFVKAELMARATGTTVSGIKQSELRQVKIPYFPISTQHKIASILSAYDDLIENNTRRILILEEMAQAIYREWFVHFRFPGHENVSMVDSDTELGEIPEGWEAKTVGAEIELAYGKGLRADRRKGGLTPVFGSGGIVGYHDIPLVDGPGIIVGRKGNVGSVYWSPTDFHPIDTTFYVVTDLPLHYVYFNLLNQQFINSDAAVPGLNRNQAYGLPIIVPPMDQLSKFEDVVKSIFHLAELHRGQNNVLRTMRDLLLPKLISGQVDVSELEIEVLETT